MTDQRHMTFEVGDTVVDAEGLSAAEWTVTRVDEPWVTAQLVHDARCIAMFRADKWRKVDPHVHSFTLRVTVRTTDDNPTPDPDDFAAFLNKRFTVQPTATYGLDAYNKDAPQLVLGVEVVS